jgi:hypothetical protein
MLTINNFPLVPCTLGLSLSGALGSFLACLSLPLVAVQSLPGSTYHTDARARETAV